METNDINQQTDYCQASLLSDDCQHVGAPYEGCDTDDRGGTTPSATADVSILSLPPELLLRMLAFVPARDVIVSVSVVCRHFHSLLSDHSSWRARYAALGVRRRPAQAAIELDMLGWRRACVQREEAVGLWGSREMMEKSFLRLAGHFAPVDCVRLMKGRGKRMCLSGSRDRTITLWDLDLTCQGQNPNGNRQAIVKSVNAHKGWVWCCAAHWPETSILCSGGWDSKVQMWNLEDIGLQPLGQIRHTSAVLSLTMPEANVLISGSYDKVTRCYDLRAPESPCFSAKSHQKPVLCLQATDNFIISGSDDKTIAIWDRRANREYKKIPVPSSVLSLHYGCGQLRAGCFNGSIYSYVGDDFQLVESSDRHSSRVTGIYQDLGMTVSCSTDFTIKIAEACTEPEVMCSLECSGCQFTGLDFDGSCLAVAGSGSSSNTSLWLYSATKT